MSEDFDFDSALKELDKSETHLTVRVEFRRWGKPVTVVQGLPKTGRSLVEIAHKTERAVGHRGDGERGSNNAAGRPPRPNQSGTRQTRLSR